MDWNQVVGNWNQFSGKLKEDYGKFTDNDLIEAKGAKEQLIAKFQKRYNVSYDEAMVKLNKVLKECSSND